MPWAFSRADHFDQDLHRLSAVNAGNRTAFMRLLELAYGRKGKLKWELREVWYHFSYEYHTQLTLYVTAIFISRFGQKTETYNCRRREIASTRIFSRT